MAQHPAIAFVDVNVIAMDREAVEAAQTVVVQGDRIVSISQTPTPDGAIVVDGTGKYLLPGLADSHVHLTTDMPWAPARSNFGEAPLYLAHGVTTVVNLRGTPTQLDWKRRIESGEVLGPTIYTSGEFVNEPRVNTTEDVEREVRSQAQAGYDLIKFHEVWTPAEGYVTTRGLSDESYLRLFHAAREQQLPVVGHVPVNLGLKGLLEAKAGAVAHVGELNRLHFLPGLTILLVTVATTISLLLLVVGFGAGALRRRWRRIPSRANGLIRAEVLSAATLGMFLLLFIGIISVLPGGRLYESDTWRVVLTVLALGFAMLVAKLTLAAINVWRERSGSVWSRRAIVVAMAMSIALLCLTSGYWIRYAWRNSETSIARVAVQLREAGISVQSTLVVYETAFDRQSTAQRVFGDHAFGFLLPDTQRRWRQIASRGQSGFLANLAEPPRFPEFTRTIAGTLHRNGVQILAGTDAMGIPMTIPGSSLLRELELLHQSGLTRYEVLRTATVNIARFLGKDDEFGTVAVGKRADLLLLEHNPLENLQTFKQPLGVMVRGTWLPRDELQKLLSRLQ
jgi:hypothetical protein